MIVLAANEVVWGEMEIATVESGGSKKEKLNNLVKNWLEDTTPNKAIDDPTVVNSACGDVKM